MAFPTFVGHGGAVQETTTTLTVVNSASAATGDYELLVIETQNEAVTLTTTGGFTAVPFNDGNGNGIWPSPNATATLATRLTVFERIYSGQADPVTNDPGNHVIANIFTFRKSSGTWSTLDDVRSPTEDTGWKAATQDTDTTSASMPGITTDTVDQLIIGITAAAKPDIAGGTTEMGTVTNSNLASITERHDDAAASGNGGWIGCWTGQEATSGQAIGSSTWTKTTTSQMAHLVIAIRDAAPGGGPISYTFASETDASQGLSKQIGIAFASETDASQGLAKKLGIAFASETDAAQGLGKKLGISFASETDSAQGIAKRLGISFASETDLAGIFSQTLILAYTAAIETDSAQGFAKRLGVGLASEVDAAQGVAKKLGFSFAPETDAALGLAKKIAFALASETDTALSITLGGATFIEYTAALETDAAQGLAKKIGLGFAEETDVAFEITVEIPAGPIVIEFLAASESDEAGEIRAHYGGGGKEGYVVWRETRNPNKTKRRLPFIGGRYIR